MNKNGQSVVGVGTFITLFISIIVGVILLISVAQTVGTTLDTASYNTTAGDAAVTFPANGASVDLEGQEYISGFLMVNATGEGTINAGNYTVSEIVSTTSGVKTISLLADDALMNGVSVNVSYIYGPDGYVENSGARGMISMIIVFFALAVAIIAMEPTVRSGLMKGMGI